MPANRVDFSLPPSVASLAQLEACRIAVEQAERGAPEPFAVLDKATRVWLAEAVSRYDAATLLKIFESIASSAPVFDIDVATPQDDELIAALVQWFRSQVAANILVRLHVRPSLLAGIRVRSGRHSYDLSLENGLRANSQTMGGIIHAG